MGRAGPLTIIHQAQHQDSSESPHISTILRINGYIGHSPFTFLLDSGAAMAIICLEAITSEFCHKIIKETTSVPVGVNGSPLGVVGQIKIPVSIEAFMTE